jgi:hypothetical protein
MNEMMSQDEFDEIADDLLVVFRDRDMSVRDAVRIMIMVSIESCIRSAPSFSVALAEITKLFVQSLAPAVDESLKAEVEHLFDKEEEDDEEI